MLNISLKIILFTIVTIAFIACGGRENFPTDDHLINMYQANKKGFQGAYELMVATNTRHYQTLPNGEVLTVPSSAQGNKMNVADMKRLLNDDIGISVINIRTESKNSNKLLEVAFLVFRNGLVTGGEVKGIVRIEDDRLVLSSEQLDVIDRNDESIHGRRMYKRIEKNWYIFYKFDR